MTLGIGLVVVGLLVSLGGRAFQTFDPRPVAEGNDLGWLGRLLGDIRIERDTVRVYLPFAWMGALSGTLAYLFATNKARG